MGITVKWIYLAISVLFLIGCFTAVSLVKGPETKVITGMAVQDTPSSVQEHAEQAYVKPPENLIKKQDKNPAQEKINDITKANTVPKSANSGNNEPISITKDEPPLLGSGSGCINISNTTTIINESKTVCPVRFKVDYSENGSAIIIDGDNIILDCSGAEIININENKNGIGIFANTEPNISKWMGLTNNLSDINPVLDNIDELVQDMSLLENITIKNCNIQGFEQGMNLSAVRNLTVNNNTLSNNGAGIIFGAYESSVKNNRVSNSNLCIAGLGVNSTIEDNEIYECDTGMLFAGLEYNLITNNNVHDTNTTGIGSAGFNTKLLSNTVNSNRGDGIVLLFAGNQQMIDNTAFNNSGAGIKTMESVGNTIVNNTLNNNKIGLTMSGLFTTGPSSANVIENNTIKNNIEAGMKFTDSNLAKFFAFLANGIRGMLGGQPIYSAPGHKVTNTLIKSNTLDNPIIDLRVKGSNFQNNIIIDNQFNGGGIDNIPCELNNALQTASCIKDSECDDGNSSTVDRCVNKGLCNSYCRNGVINVNGTIYDENGNPAESVRISFYPSSLYDPVYDTGDDSLLVPKPLGDVTTDASGYYEIFLPDHTVWHMVMQGSKKIDFNVHTNKTKGKGHDSDIFENETYDPNTDFNVEGHIIHSGAYEHGNNYTCSQYVEFTMFGRNRGDTNVTITFAVENHTDGGGPTNNRHVCDGVAGLSGDPEVPYCSDINEENKTLFLPADKKKYKKIYTFQIPCDWNPGKYDIHVYDNSKWGKMHKIGNFFIIDNYLSPWVSGINGTIYSNEMFNMTYAAARPDPPETIPDRESYVTIQAFMPEIYCDLNVTIDFDIEVDTDGDNITDNDADANGCGGVNNHYLLFGVNYVNTSQYPTPYDRAKVHTTKLTVVDINDGAQNVSLVNVTVYITEDEADVISESIYRTYFFEGKLPYDWGDEWYDVYATISTVPVNSTWDRYADLGNQIGDEYLSAEGISQSDADALEYRVQNCNGPPFMKPIPSSTANDYILTLESYLLYLKCPYGCNRDYLLPEGTC
ncbi:nitrous oxide reductase family maturation protein NosD [Thermoproteota archaeon]